MEGSNNYLSYSGVAVEESQIVALAGFRLEFRALVEIARANLIQLRRAKIREFEQRCDVLDSMSFARL